MSLEPKDCVIFVPTRGTLHYETMEALVLQVFTAMNDYGQPLHVHFIQGNASVSSVRNQIVREFLGMKDKELLIMIDDDVIVPENFLSILQSCDQYDIVGAPCMIVRPGTIHMPNVFWFNKEKGKYEVRKEVYDSTGILECDGVGGGCIAVNRRVFAKVKKPFDFKTDRDGVIETGEDLRFCERARSQGFSVAADFNVFCEHMQTIHGASLAHAYVQVLKTIGVVSDEATDQTDGGELDAPTD